MYLGDMWAQNWNNLVDLFLPFKKKLSPDITPALREKVIMLFLLKKLVFDNPEHILFRKLRGKKFLMFCT